MCAWSACWELGMSFDPSGTNTAHRFHGKAAFWGWISLDQGLLAGTMDPGLEPSPRGVPGTVGAEQHPGPHPSMPGSPNLRGP